MRPGFYVVGLALLVACSAQENTGDRASAREEKLLNVYNWTDYVGESTIANFEARTGIKVNYDVFDTGEVLETKLLTGRSGYDIVVPAGARANPLIQAGALRKLDKSQLENLSNLNSEFMQTLAGYDPGNEYGLPYLWGTTGIGYNADVVEEFLGKRSIDSLAAVFDPAIASKLAKCGITMLNSPESMFELAYIYLGLEMTSERPEHRLAAEKLLTAVRPYIRYFDSSQYISDLASGEVCISIGWSFGVMQARLRGATAKVPVEIVYVIPKEGAPLVADFMSIPADAPHPDNAHAFLDYLMEPRVIAEVSNVVLAANGNAAAQPFVTNAIRNDPAVYPPQEVFERLHLETDWSHETVRELGRAWTRIRTGT